MPTGGARASARLRVVLVVNLSLFALAAGVALASLSHTGSNNWDLFVALALFALASELLATSALSRAWVITSSGPYVLAITLLGPAQALMIGVLALAVDSVRRRPGLGVIASNLGNYATFLVGGALLFGWLANRLALGPADPAFMLIVLSAFVWVVVISDVMCAAYSVAQGSSWRSHFQSLLGPQLGAELPSALLAAATAYGYGLAGVGALALLALVQLTFQSFVGQLMLSQQRAFDLEQRTNQISDLSASRGRLLQQSIAAEEHERKRLAEALHNNALQNLLVARQDLAELEFNRAGRRRIETAVEATIDQLRHEICELHPGVLNQVGLAPALQAVADRQAAAGGFSTRVAVDGNVSGAHDPLLFSLGRELLTNAARHAEPSAVALQVRRSNGSIFMEAHDNGRGFEPSRLQQVLGEGHIGLASCKERVEALGGSLEIHSRTGRGTTIRARLPVAARRAP